MTPAEIIRRLYQLGALEGARFRLKCKPPTVVEVTEARPPKDNSHPIVARQLDDPSPYRRYTYTFDGFYFNRNSPCTSDLGELVSHETPALQD